MTNQSPFKQLPMVPMVIGGVMMGLGCIVILATIYMSGAGQMVAGIFASSTPTSTSTSTATVTPLSTSTPTATQTPLATPTATATNTPPPTATLPPRPQPTKPPTAVPTNTPAPTDPPLSYWYNLTVLDFSLEQSSQPKGAVWFNFYVRNTAGPLTFGYLGVNAFRSNGSLYQFHYSYIDYTLPGDLQWRDHVDIDEAGTFNIYLVICYDTSNVCNGSSTAKWETLRGPISINIY